MATLRPGSSESRAREGRAWALLPVVSGLLFVLLAFDAAQRETPTIDEFAHVPAGFAYLEDARFELYAKNPPGMQALLAVPAWLSQPVVVPTPRRLSQSWGPWIYGYQFMTANESDYFDIFSAARVVVIVLTCVAGALLFAWAHSLFGLAGASVATSLFLLSPMILAHGHLATVDVACMTSLFAAVWCLRQACLARSAVRVALAGAVFGVALLAKFTALLMAPLLLGLILWHGRRRGKATAIDLATFSACALLVVNIAMGFDGSLRPLSSFEPKSQLMIGLQDWLPASTPVPVPEDYLVGFDAVRVDTERGEFGSYLLGEWSQEGRWYYNLVAFGAKSPLLLLAMLGVAPFFLHRSGLSAREASFVVLPPLMLGVLLAGFNRAGIGLRYLLPVYPFLFLAVASLWSRWRGGIAAGAGVLAVAGYALLAGWNHPSHLGYFNALAGGAAGGHRVLVDSNLDWGQDLYRLPAALEELGVDEPIGLLYFGHVFPGIYGISYELVPAYPQEGVFAVSVTFLMGNPYVAIAPNGELVDIGREHAAWLREREPVARLGSIWLFDTREH